MRNYFNKFWLAVLVITATLFTPFSSAYSATFGGDSFEKVFYFTHGGKGAQSGLGLANAKQIADTDIMSIEPGMIITKVFVIVDTAVAGLSKLDVGDDDDPDGFVIGSRNYNYSPVPAGLHGWQSKNGGAYLRVESGGAYPDAYVVPSAKYYSAAGKEVKLDVTGSSSAGAFRVVVQGYKAAY